MRRVLAFGASVRRRAVPATLHDAPGCVTKDAPTATRHRLEMPYVFCDDGVPSRDPLPGPGGIDPQRRPALSAVTVPAKYETAGTRSPACRRRRPTPRRCPAPTPRGDIALDVDVSLPDDGAARRAATR